MHYFIYIMYTAHYSMNVFYEKVTIKQHLFIFFG